MIKNEKMYEAFKAKANLQLNFQLCRAYLNDNTSVLGIVENMSYLECPKCKEKIDLYGKSKLEEYAKENELTPLCALPLRPEMSKLLDSEKVEEVALHFEEIDKVLEVLEK